MKNAFWASITWFFLIPITVYPFSEDALSQRIETTLNQRRYENVNVSILISKLHHKKQPTLIYKRHINTPQIPASLMKCLLTQAALSKWGPEKKFKTPIYITKPNHPKGPNLYIKGAGDPSLTTQHIGELISTLKKNHINTINQFIVDTSYFDTDPPASHNSATYYYAPSNSLNINFNQIHFFIKKNTLQWFPKTHYASINTSEATILPTSKKRGRPRITTTETTQGNHYQFKGLITSQDERYQGLNVRVTKPTQYFIAVTQDLFHEHNIKIHGETHVKPFNRLFKRHLYTMTSPPLSDILTTLNQNSDNMIAKTLNKALGADTYGAPGTLKKGTQYLTKFCTKKLRFKSTDFLIDDPSGLSEKNQLSAYQLTLLFNYAYQHNKKTFFESLTNPRTNDHYQEMYKNTPFYIRFKTGTLSRKGVNNIAMLVMDPLTKETYNIIILAERSLPGKRVYTGTFTDPLVKVIIKTLQEKT